MLVLSELHFNHLHTVRTKTPSLNVFLSPALIIDKIIEFIFVLFPHETITGEKEHPVNMLTISSEGLLKVKKEKKTSKELASIRGQKEVKDYFTFPEEGMGIGIASRIAALGIYGNLALTEYVNQVGNIVVEATDVYDINYRFFILDVDEVNG